MLLTNQLTQEECKKYFYYEDDIEDAIEYRDSAREASGLLPAKDNNSC